MDDVTRHGKFLDISASGLHLVMHLARAGWVRWRDELPSVPPKPSPKSPLAARRAPRRRRRLRPHRGRDEEAPGDLRRAAARGRARASPASARTRSPTTSPSRRCGGILDDAGRAQVKGVLRHQGTIAGIGNAYSDEVLHAARMSPFKPASSLTDDELAHPVRRHPRPCSATRSTARAASPPRELKGEKKTTPGRPRTHRPDVPGVRRHGARGLVRRLEPAVLPHLPDRRQATGRPADVAPAQVTHVGRARRRRTARRQGGSAQSGSRCRYAARLISTTPSPARCGVRHWTSSSRRSREAVGELLHQPDQRRLGGVGLAVEHRLPGEQATDRHAVHARRPAGRRARSPRECAQPSSVQPEVRRRDRAVDPAAGPGRVGAAVHHRLERRVHPQLEPARRTGAATGRRAGGPPGARPRLNRTEPVRRRLRRTGRHREQAPPVGRQQRARLEVGADRDQVVVPGRSARGRETTSATAEAPRARRHRSARRIHAMSLKSSVGGMLAPRVPTPRPGSPRW